MSLIFRSKASLINLLTRINEYTGNIKENLTDAVKELIIKSDRDYSLLVAVLSGTAEELTAGDLKGITKITNHLFFNNTSLRYLELPESVTALGDNCFYGCTELSIPFLPEGIERLGYNNFYHCKRISFTKLPDALNYIGENVFSGCESLRISEIPEGVTYIGRGAFASCTALETVTFKSTPTKMDRGIFAGCTNLRSINVPWAEGEVANAPWGAENAEINYNYLPEDN